MAQRIIDLAVSLTAGIASDPKGLGPEIDYLDHAAGARDFQAMFGVPEGALRDGAGAAAERCRITTHNGTHMDAPWHYHPTMNGGERAMTIDEIPLDWCFGPGVKLDFRHLPNGHTVTAAEVAVALAIVIALMRNKATLKVDEIDLMKG